MSSGLEVGVPARRAKPDPPNTLADDSACGCTDFIWGSEQNSAGGQSEAQQGGADKEVDEEAWEKSALVPLCEEMISRRLAASLRAAQVAVATGSVAVNGNTVGEHQFTMVSELDEIVVHCDAAAAEPVAALPETEPEREKEAEPAQHMLPCGGSQELALLWLALVWSAIVALLIVVFF